MYERWPEVANKEKRKRKMLMWGIWRERNAWNFEGSERLIQDLKLSFFLTLFEWTNALEIFTFTSLPDLLDSCTFHAS